MQCIVKKVYSILVVEVVWWDSPLMNNGSEGNFTNNLTCMCMRTCMARVELVCVYVCVYVCAYLHLNASI